MPAYPRTGDFPEALLSIFFAILEKSPGGATMDDLKEAYAGARGKLPSEKTIRRAVHRLKTFFDPLAGQTCGEGEQNFSLIKTEKRRGQTYYIFTGSLAAAGMQPADAMLTIFSLYPQQRGVLRDKLREVMRRLFTNSLMGISYYALLLREMERSVHVSGFTPLEPVKTMETIKKILYAVAERKRLCLEYLRAYDGAVTRREVEPYGLLCRFNDWYLTGRCLLQNERRTFLLSHIRRLEIVENSTFTMPANFSLAAAYGDNWGVWTGDGPGEPERVRLRVAAGAAERFRVIKYHDSQQVTDLDGGGAEVTYTVTGTRAMLPWLMSWGDRVEVLEPSWLRENLAAALKAALDIYR